MRISKVASQKSQRRNNIVPLSLRVSLRTASHETQINNFRMAHDDSFDVKNGFWTANIMLATDMFLCAAESWPRASRTLHESGVTKDDLNCVQEIIFEALRKNSDYQQSDEHGHSAAHRKISRALRAVEAVRWTVGRMLQQARFAHEKETDGPVAKFVNLAFLRRCCKSSEQAAELLITADGKGDNDQKNDNRECNNVSFERRAIAALEFAKHRLQDPDSLETICSSSCVANCAWSKIAMAYMMGVHFCSPKRTLETWLVVASDRKSTKSKRVHSETSWKHTCCAAVLSDTEEARLVKGLLRESMKTSSSFSALQTKTGALRIAFEMANSKARSMCQVDTPTPACSAAKRKRRERAARSSEPCYESVGFVRECDPESKDDNEHSRPNGASIGFRQDWCHYLVENRGRLQGSRSLRSDHHSSVLEPLQHSYKYSTASSSRIDVAIELLAFAEALGLYDQWSGHEHQHMNNMNNTDNTDNNLEVENVENALKIVRAAMWQELSSIDEPCCSVFVLKTHRLFFEKTWEDFNVRLLDNDSPWKPSLEEWMNKGEDSKQVSRKSQKLMSAKQMQLLQQRVARSLLTRFLNLSNGNASIRFNASLLLQILHHFGHASYASACIRSFCTYRSRGRAREKKDNS